MPGSWGEIVVNLKYSETFKRNIRQGTWEELGKPTWDLIRESIQTGSLDETLELLDYAANEVKVMHDTEHTIAEASSAYIADTFGEEAFEKFWRMLCDSPVVPAFLAAPSLEDIIKQTAECQRGHFGSISITEEPDKYIVKYEPCGSLGRLWETRNVGLTKKPHPWSWNKAGVPYWCAHCNIMFETVPAEKTGYPGRVTFAPEKPGDPCVHYYYKNPESIPDEYFARIGKTKPNPTGK